MTCSACGADIPVGSRFCPACGQPLETRADERRVVTVLFADLVGFTHLSEARDPEQVKNLVDRCFERLVADVHAFGGRVDKIVGDAIVALFGAPVAHEDDAERAVRSALQMQRTLSTFTGQLGVRVQLRIGVNTGEVLVGALRAGGDYTAMGDVVNVASRLQTLAAPGKIIVGAATYNATKEIVAYDGLGEVQARGREEPIKAWEAKAALAPPGHRPRRAVTPLVGRDEELGMLRLALASSATRRRAHLVLLVGEAGIGKSRLAEELAGEAAAGRRALVLEGRCVPYGEANVWWPVAEAVRQACDIDASDPDEVAVEKCRIAVHMATDLPADGPEVARLANGLRYLMGDEGVYGAVDPARASEDARRSLLILVEALAKKKPLVLVLSELHWADALVLELVDQLLDRVQHLPVLVLATARSELEGRWTPKPGRHNLIVIHLDPLDSESARSLLTVLLGEEPSPTVRDLLLDRSGGNPFFLEELVALLGDAGVLSGGAGALGEGRAAQELPATLWGLVAARLDALPREERATLEDAAVLGHGGPVAALAALGAGRGESRVEVLLDALADKDLLSVVDGECQFRSELVREVAYETLTKGERARRHAAVADWLASAARRTDRQDEYLEQLAHHYAAAAELAKELGGVDGVPEDICEVALDAIERAAIRSHQRELHAASLRLLDRALGLLPPSAEKAQRRVLLERAKARTALHDLAGARDDVDRVLAQIEGGHHPLSHARALTALGRIEQAAGNLDASAATLTHAIEVWRAVGDVRGEAEALALRGMTHLFGGDPAAAEAAIREALEAFRTVGASRDEAWALWNLAWISFVGGDLLVAEQRLAKSRAAFQAANDWGGMHWVDGLLAWVRYLEGRRADAEALVMPFVDELRVSGDNWAAGMVFVLLASVRLWEGRTGEAIEPAREARELFKAMQDLRGQVQATAVLSRALVATGRVGEGLALLDDLRTLSHPSHMGAFGADTQMAIANVAIHLGDGESALTALADRSAHVIGDVEVPEVACYRGLALLQSGRTTEAVASLRTAVDGAAAAGPRAASAATLALAQAAAGSLREAVDAANEALATEVATYLDRTYATLALAFVAVQVGDAAGAMTRFAEALSLVDGTGDRLQQAAVRLARARGLEALGDERADDAVADAGGHFDLLGLPTTGWDTVYHLAAQPQASRAAS